MAGLGVRGLSADQLDELDRNGFLAIESLLTDESLRLHSNIGMTTWHQDIVALLPDADDTRIVTVWVPLTDAFVGDLADGVGASAHLMAERLVHRRHPIHGAIAARARQLRHNLGFYDALYIALAERLHCQLITADNRIARAFKGHDLTSAITPDD